MPKPLEYFEKFYKLSPYVIPVITGLGKGTETMTGIGGWLSGEDYTGNNTYSTRMTGADKREVGYRGFGSPYRESPTGAFGGFENTARDFFTGHGYSQLGNLAGDTINLLGEIASTPFELGLQAQDLGRGFLSNLKEHTPDWLQRNVSGLAGAYMQLQEDKRGRGSEGGKDQGSGRPTHRQITNVPTPQISRLAQARRLEQQRQGYAGGVYDPKVAQLLNYALHELQPTIIKEMRKTQLARSYYDVGGVSIGRGRGIG